MIIAFYFYKKKWFCLIYFNRIFFFYLFILISFFLITTPCQSSWINISMFLRWDVFFNKLLLNYLFINLFRCYLVTEFLESVFFLCFYCFVFFVFQFACFARIMVMVIFLFITAPANWKTKINDKQKRKLTSVMLIRRSAPVGLSTPRVSSSRGCGQSRALTSVAGSQSCSLLLMI